MAGECKWATEDKVRKGCHSDCGHFARDLKTCMSICTQKPMKRYLAWTKGKCTPAAREKCDQDLASLLGALSLDRSTATAYEAVIYYRLHGHKPPEDEQQP